MTLQYNSNLKKDLDHPSKMRRKYGVKIATLLYEKLKEIEHATNINDLFNLAGFHSLRFQKGMYSIPISGSSPLRIVVDNGVSSDMLQVKAILDYHHTGQIKLKNL